MYQTEIEIDLWFWGQTRISRSIEIEITKKEPGEIEMSSISALFSAILFPSALNIENGGNTFHLLNS